jgi:hypothetical protein
MLSQIFPRVERPKVLEIVEAAERLSLYLADEENDHRYQELALELQSLIEQSKERFGNL